MKKPTILHWNTIKSQVKKYRERNSEISKGDLSRAFLGMVLENYLDLSEEEIELSITDGSNDKGIDAIYIDTSNSNEPIVYLVQSKFYRSEQKWDRDLEATSIQKMRDAIDMYVFSRKSLHLVQSIDLKNKLQDIYALENPKYKIIFASNSLRPVQNSIDEWEYFLTERGGHGYIDTIYLDISELWKMIAPPERKKVNYQLQFTGDFLKVDSGDVRMLVGTVELFDLAKLRKAEGDYIFDLNVRKYLKSRNEINKKIVDTASNNEKSNYFLYLNNGITVTCDRYEYSPIKESPNVKIENLQIVNGCQTTNAIYEAYDNNLLKEGRVIVRLLESKKEGLLEDIILCTNSQSKVSSRDLSSTDEIQRGIKKQMSDKGFFYEAKKNEFEQEDKDKRLDSEKVAQAYYSVFKKKPHDAKNKKNKLFTDFYSDIFNNETDVDELILAYFLYNKVMTLRKSYKEKYSFIAHATLFIAYFLYEKGVNKLAILEDDDMFIPIFEMVLNAIDKVVDEKNKEEGGDYSHRATFIDSNTVGRIEEVLNKNN